MNERRYRPGVAVVDGKIYVCGGEEGWDRSVIQISQSAIIMQGFISPSSNLIIFLSLESRNLYNV